MRTWREATTAALYGPAGFYRRHAPADHFRTSVHASGLFAVAVARLAVAVDAALGRPETFTVVDLGAGRGELLAGLARAVPADLRRRLRLVAVELAARPAGLPPEVEWRTEPPAGTRGLLVATEWLDNIPLDLAVDGRLLLVDPATGAEADGPPVTPADGAWLARWWPAGPGQRAEIGVPRDAAWAAALSTVERGVALAVDYGHLADGRPVAGTLTGFRAGREVPPVPDGSMDVTAHVAMDSLPGGGVLVRQREALRALDVTGRRPPLSWANADPAGYVRALALASQAAELTDPAGLGDHWWLVQGVGVRLADLGVLPARAAYCDHAQHGG